MSYGRARADAALDSQVVTALAAQRGLHVSPEEAQMLTALLANQGAAQEALDAFDLRDIVPAITFSLEDARDD